MGLIKSGQLALDVSFSPLPMPRHVAGVAPLTAALSASLLFLALLLAAPAPCTAQTATQKAILDMMESKGPSIHVQDDDVSLSYAIIDKYQCSSMTGSHCIALHGGGFSAAHAAPAEVDRAMDSVVRKYARTAHLRVSTLRDKPSLRGRRANNAANSAAAKRGATGTASNPFASLSAAAASSSQRAFTSVLTAPSLVAALTQLAATSKAPADASAVATSSAGAGTEGREAVEALLKRIYGPGSKIEVREEPRGTWHISSNTQPGQYAASAAAAAGATTGANGMAKAAAVPLAEIDYDAPASDAIFAALAKEAKRNRALKAAGIAPPPAAHANAAAVPAAATAGANVGGVTQLAEILVAAAAAIESGNVKGAIISQSQSQSPSQQTQAEAGGTVLTTQGADGATVTVLSMEDAVAQLKAFKLAAAALTAAPSQAEQAKVQFQAPAATVTAGDASGLAQGKAAGANGGDKAHAALLSRLANEGYTRVSSGANTNADVDADADASADTDVKANANAVDADTKVSANANAKADPHANTNAHANPNANAKASAKAKVKAHDKASAKATTQANIDGAASKKVGTPVAPATNAAPAAPANAANGAPAVPAATTSVAPNVHVVTAATGAATESGAGGDEKADAEAILEAALAARRARRPVTANAGANKDAAIQNAAANKDTSKDTVASTKDINKDATNKDAPDTGAASHDNTEASKGAVAGDATSKGTTRRSRNNRNNKNKGNSDKANAPVAAGAADAVASTTPAGVYNDAKKP